MVINKEQLEEVILESMSKPPTDKIEVAKRYTREMAKDIAEGIDTLIEAKIDPINAGVRHVQTTPTRGDVNGRFPQLSVVGIQGKPVSADGPSIGDVFTWTGSEWAPQASQGGATDFDPATGDVSGTYPSLTVDGLQGIPVSSTAPVSGNILTYDGINWNPQMQPAASVGAASQDISGTYPTLYVTGFKGSPLAATTPVSGDIYSFNGTTWIPMQALSASSPVIAKWNRTDISQLTAISITNSPIAGTVTHSLIAASNFNEPLISLSASSFRGLGLFQLFPTGTIPRKCIIKYRVMVSGVTANSAHFGGLVIGNRLTGSEFKGIGFNHCLGPNANRIVAYDSSVVTDYFGGIISPYAVVTLPQTGAADNYGGRYEYEYVANTTTPGSGAYKFHVNGISSKIGQGLAGQVGTNQLGSMMTSLSGWGPTNMDTLYLVISANAGNMSHTYLFPEITVLKHPSDQ